MHCSHLIIAGVLGLGGPELILIFAVVMLLFGGKRLPELATGLGKSIKEFKRASRETEESLSQALHAPAAPPATIAENPPPSQPAVAQPALMPAPVPTGGTPRSS